jgi:UDP-2,3-diacylglucosamine pyrophosphatase LpxH
MSEIVEALFVSDLHLGSKQSNVDKIISLLDDYTPKHLFLVGDIIHGWILNLKWNTKHSMVLDRIKYLSNNGTKVIWIPGNHDNFMRDFKSFGNIEIHSEYVWNETLITHGDLYDGIVWIKRIAPRFRMIKFHEELNKRAIKLGCKSIICGHIHISEDKMVNGIRYINTGDWIYSNSYVTFNGEKYILHRPKIKKVPYYFDYSKLNYKFGYKQEKNDTITISRTSKTSGRN